MRCNTLFDHMGSEGGARAVKKQLDKRYVRILSGFFFCLYFCSNSNSICSLPLRAFAIFLSISFIVHQIILFLFNVFLYTFEWGETVLMIKNTSPQSFYSFFFIQTRSSVQRQSIEWGKYKRKNQMTSFTIRRALREAFLCFQTLFVKASANIIS